jgi:hypothetical protein
MARVLRRIEQLVPGRAYSEKRMFEYYPWRVWGFGDGTKADHWVLLERVVGQPHPHASLIRITLFDASGHVFSITDFSAGYRVYPRDAELLAVEGSNPLIVLDSPLSPGYAKQYYALVGDRFDLVRLEGLGGEARRNGWRRHGRACGPPRPWTNEVDCVADLLSENRWRVLRSLVWLGSEGPLARTGTRPAVEGAQLADLRFLQRVRGERGVLERIRELAQSSDEWVREAARLAASTGDAE